MATATAIQTVNVNLSDYLRPHGTKPYAALHDDLQRYLDSGLTVYLWSVCGQFMLAGHPNLVETGRPWSDGDKWYRTSKDAMDHKKGR